MSPRALIVGGTGFVGRHLAQRLSNRYEVVTSGRADDIRDPKRMLSLVANTRPEVVVNLAALTTVRETFQSPRETYEVGLLGLLNLFEALKTCDFKGHFLEVSSSEIYGIPAADQLPLTEATPLSPLHPYAVAKLAAEALCHQWRHSEALDIKIARPFTHIGPGQSSRFSVANFVHQVAKIMAGRHEPVVRVGDLTTTRDLTDVRDVVRAYDAIIHQGRSGGIYNVCSGEEIAMRTVLDELIRLSGMDIEIVIDAGLLRRAEQLRLRGIYTALKADTGWQPEIPLISTLKDTLQYALRQSSELAAK